MTAPLAPTGRYRLNPTFASGGFLADWLVAAEEFEGAAHVSPNGYAVEVIVEGTRRQVPGSLLQRLPDPLPQPPVGSLVVVLADEEEGMRAFVHRRPDEWKGTGDGYVWTWKDICAAGTPIVVPMVLIKLTPNGGPADA